MPKTSGEVSWFTLWQHFSTKQQKSTEHLSVYVHLDRNGGGSEQLDVCNIGASHNMQAEQWAVGTTGRRNSSAAPPSCASLRYCCYVCQAFIASMKLTLSLTDTAPPEEILSDFGKKVKDISDRKVCSMNLNYIYMMSPEKMVYGYKDICWSLQITVQQLQLVFYFIHKKQGHR